MMYRSGHGAAALIELDEREIERRYLDDLFALYPQMRGHVAETLILKLPRMLPVVSPGRGELQRALEQPLGRVHLAGDYLGGTYTETAIATAQEAAAAVRRALPLGEDRIHNRV